MQTGQQTGNVPGEVVQLGHCCNKTTRDKLAAHLDTMREMEIEFVALVFVGGRDYEIWTYGTYIPGLAGRRVFT